MEIHFNYITKRSWNCAINSSKLCQPNFPQNAATYKRKKAGNYRRGSLQFDSLSLVMDRVIGYPEVETWVLGFLEKWHKGKTNHQICQKFSKKISKK